MYYRQEEQENHNCFNSYIPRAHIAWIAIAKIGLWSKNFELDQTTNPAVHNVEYMMSIGGCEFSL